MAWAYGSTQMPAPHTAPHITPEQCFAWTLRQFETQSLLLNIEHGSILETEILKRKFTSSGPWAILMLDT